MRNKYKYIGQIDDKIFFTLLPKVKDPIARGLDEESELLGCFLSEWNSLISAESLLEYLYIIKNKDDSNEEYAELKRFGIYSEFDGSSLLFKDKGVVISSEVGHSEIISLDIIISIVENWKKYLMITEDKDVVFYGGRFFFDLKTIDENYEL